MNWPVVAPCLELSMSLPKSSGSDPTEGPTSASSDGKGRSPRELRITQRSMRYHRPRAPFCGIGYCTNCIVRTPGRLNDRACLREFRDGDATASSHGWPSVRFDLEAWIDLVFPRGIDILHGFRRPTWAVPAYQRAVRSLSGYGRPPTTTAAVSPTPPPLLKEVDVAILGGGLSGRATATELRSHGLDSVYLIDRSMRRGDTATPFDLNRTTALFLPPPDPRAERPFTVLASREDGQAVVLRSRRVVVATGGYDASLLFAGNDRPGVMTADGAFSFASSGFRPFRRAVVFGDGPRALSVIDRFGDLVSAVVAPAEIGPDLARAASDRGVPLYPRSLLLRANGRRWVRSVTLRARGKGATTTLSADAVVLAHRRVPHPQLFFQAGARMRWSSATAAYYPEADAMGATSVEGLYAVGEARAPATADTALVSARQTAQAILTAEPVGETVTPQGPPAHPLEGYYRELLQEPQGLGKWVACPCEDVLLNEIETAHRRGYRGIEVIKRYTGVGTGLCQGRYCLPDALLVLSILEGRPPSDVGFITQRPPVVPTRLDTLASAVDLLRPSEER